MSLSREEAARAVEMRQQYLNIFIKWSKNPASFEHNVACLAEMRQWLIPYMNFFMRYAEEAQGQMHGHGFFAKLGAARKMKKAAKVATAIQNTIFNDAELKQQFRKIFTMEPRITGLNANLNEEHNEKIRGNVVVSREDVSTGTYTISFADDTKIVLHSLTDEKTLADAKVAFEAKMQSLSNVQVIGLR